VNGKERRKRKEKEEKKCFGLLVTFIATKFR
jgi:hypothetical protein